MALSDHLSAPRFPTPGSGHHQRPPGQPLAASALALSTHPRGLAEQNPSSVYQVWWFPGALGRAPYSWAWLRCPPDLTPPTSFPVFLIRAVQNHQGPPERWGPRSGPPLGTSPPPPPLGNSLPFKTQLTQVALLTTPIPSGHCVYHTVLAHGDALLGPSAHWSQ